MIHFSRQLNLTTSGLSSLHLRHVVFQVFHCYYIQEGRRLVKQADPLLESYLDYVNLLIQN